MHKGMKRFFRRLSSKKESNLHSSPVKPSWPSVSSHSLPATGDSSCSRPFQQLHDNSIPAAQLTVGQEHDSSQAGSFSTAPLHTFELEKQATQPPFGHLQSKAQVDTPMLQLSLSREAVASTSASGTSKRERTCSMPSDYAPHNNTNSSQQQPASIYRSYNDFDIMSSGTFDFSQHHLLSTAPDADWFDREHVTERLPEKPQTARELSQHCTATNGVLEEEGTGPEMYRSRSRSGHGYQWDPQPTRTPSSQLQPASQTNTSNQHIPYNRTHFSSPDESARSWTVPYSGPISGSARQGVSQAPANQRMVTPFAKYASQSMSGPLLSADLDTAMRANGQVPHHEGFHNGQTSGTSTRAPSARNRVQFDPSHSNGARGTALRPQSLDGHSLPPIPVNSPRGCRLPSSHERASSVEIRDERAQSGAQVAPGSSCGTPRSTSHSKRQGFWSSETLSRQLEQDFSLAGHTANGAPRMGHHDCCTNGRPYANGETSGNGTPHVKGQSKAVAAQNQQPNKQAAVPPSSASSSGNVSSSVAQQSSFAHARMPPSHIQEANRQVEQALQTADQQIQALRARVTKKNAQLSEAKLRLQYLHEDLQDGAASHRHHPSSLPDTDSSEQTEMAAAEMQLLRQALDKLQSETQVLDDELARAREQAIFSELERAELSSDLEVVTAQLHACEASKAELEGTISKLLSDVQGKSRKRYSSRPLLHTDSFRSHMSPRSPAADLDLLSSSPHMGRSASGLSSRSNSALLCTMPSLPTHQPSSRDMAALEAELERLRGELEGTKYRLESDVARAREDALGVMRATGDADAEVRRLMSESAELNSAQQEAEAHLQQSKQTIQELQAALKTAQAAMATDRLEREEALITIAQLRQQQQQQAEQQSHMPKQDAAEVTQHIAELDRQVAELANSNDELSTDLGRALDVAQRVIDQKSKLQEQCQSHEQQLLQWQAEAQRVKELEGFADEALSALEAQTQENSRLRQQIAAEASAAMPVAQ